MQRGKIDLLAFYFSPLKRRILEELEEEDKGLMMIACFLYYFINSLRLVKIGKYLYITNTLVSHVTFHSCINYVNYQQKLLLFVIQFTSFMDTVFLPILFWLIPLILKIDYIKLLSLYWVLSWWPTLHSSASLALADVRNVLANLPEHCKGLKPNLNTKK